MAMTDSRTHTYFNCAQLWYVDLARGGRAGLFRARGAVDVTVYIDLSVSCSPGALQWVCISIELAIMG